MKKPAIVIPTNRDEIMIFNFLNAWKEEFRDCIVYLIQDREKKIKFPIWDEFELKTFDWKDIDKELGIKNPIPKKSSAIRSYGFFKAWQDDALFIISLDDDCRPYTKDFVREHWRKLNQKVNPFMIPTLNNGMDIRGFIDDKNMLWKTGINMGGWINNPDFSAQQTINYGKYQLDEYDFNNTVVPKGAFYSLCGMNFAFKTELVPLMYFPKTKNIDRYDDIWCGFLSKEILDRFNYAVKIGPPFIEHTRASNLWTNLNKECLGDNLNSSFLKELISYQCNFCQRENIIDEYKNLLWILNRPTDTKHKELYEIYENITKWLKLFNLRNLAEFKHNE